MEDDSNEEKSGCEVDSRVKGSGIRKPVPPPMPALLLERFRRTVSRVGPIVRRGTV